MIYKFFIFTLLLLSGCSQKILSMEERQKLNSLDAHDTVETYFNSGNLEVEYYLSSNEERERSNALNLVREIERIGGVEDLLVKEDASSASKTKRLFVVNYTSQHRNSLGDPPGPRMWFVYVIQEPETKLWKIDSLGSGP